MWAPLETPVVLQLIEYGDVVSAAPRALPSSVNWTLVTPTLSEAFAETVTAVPLTVVLAAGAGRDTVGAWVSGPDVVVKVASAELAVFPRVSAERTR